jgi:hypothetical protein
VTSGLPSWTKDVGTLIGLGLSLVAVVRLVASGWSAFLEALTWVGGACLIAITLFCLFAALKPNKADAPEDEKPSLGNRAFFASVAIVLPVASLWMLSMGAKWILWIAGASILGATGVFIYLSYQGRQFLQRPSLRRCPDCAEDVKEEAHVCVFRPGLLARGRLGHRAGQRSPSRSGRPSVATC